MSVAEEVARIDDLLRSKGLKHKWFFEKAGIDPVSWWRWRRGEAEPKLSSWRAVERTLQEIGE